MKVQRQQVPRPHSVRIKSPSSSRGEDRTRDEEGKAEDEEGVHLVMAATAIGEDLDAAECQEDVWGSWCEQLLTRLWRQSQIPSANGHMLLTYCNLFLTYFNLF